MKRARGMQFQRGTAVEILSGPYRSCPAVFIERARHGDRFIVCINLGNVQTRLAVERDQIRLAQVATKQSGAVSRGGDFEPPSNQQKPRPKCPKLSADLR
jgi:hypothetical protein